MAGPDPLAELLFQQSGVIARSQALAAGLAPHDVRRLLRRREWTCVHGGVYVNHTGPLEWAQRAWAGVLAVAPAALTHASAIRATNGPGRRDHDDRGPIHVAVARERRSLVAPDGVRLHHLARLDAKVQWNTSPPRVRIHHAVLDVAAESRDDLTTIATLADAVQARLTTPARLLDAMATRGRIGRRSFIGDVLRDVDAGACSALEHGYLTLVERDHHLPIGSRQVRESTRGPVYRDVEYAAYGLLLELDGRLVHGNAKARHLDLDRDLAAAVSGRYTVRLGWGQVYGTSCETAAAIGALLRHRGWSGQERLCPRCVAAA